MRYVLGIETSCDETAAAIYDADKGLLAHEVYSQTETHEKFGGVVPELASRDHIQKLLPLIQRVFSAAKIKPNEINGVAYTKGPGLIGALMVGATIGRSLAYAWGVPALGVHHMEAHLMAAMMEPDPPSYPFVALLVSGGHTQLVSVHELGSYHVLGESVDDAVGEAFDKVAKLLNLPYPGGPLVAALAEQGNPERFQFPRPMTNREGLDFSFSGLKTAVMTCVNSAPKDDQTKADIAAAFEAAAVDTLLIKSQRALAQTGYKQLVVVGGVSANKKLRERLIAQMTELGAHVYFPNLEFCTDNAAMVAYTGLKRLQAGQKEDLDFNVKARWSIGDLKIPVAS